MTLTFSFHRAVSGPQLCNPGREILSFTSTRAHPKCASACRHFYFVSRPFLPFLLNSVSQALRQGLGFSMSSFQVLPTMIKAETMGMLGINCVWTSCLLSRLWTSSVSPHTFIGHVIAWKKCITCPYGNLSDRPHMNGRKELLPWESPVSADVWKWAIFWALAFCSVVSCRWRV